MKRKYVMGLLLVLLVIVMVGCGNSGKEGKDRNKTGDSKETITLKFAVPQPETHNMNKIAYIPFMEKVTELTDGQVQFEFYPAEQLGKAEDLLDLTSNGVADIGVYFPGYYSSKMPITSPLMQMPGLYSTSYEGTMALHELNKKSPVLEKDFLNNGVRPILSYAAPPSELWTKGKEIKVPEDMKGSKVKVGGVIMNKATTALSASPVNINVAEMYEGFERGVFNVINLNIATVSDYGVDELVTYGTKGVDFGGANNGLMINEKVFQGLPKNVQEVIVQVGDEMSGTLAKFYDEHSEGLTQQFKDAGVSVYELSEDEQAQWLNFYNEIEGKLVKEQNNPDLEASIEAFKAIIKK